MIECLVLGKVVMGCDIVLGMNAISQLGGVWVDATGVEFGRAAAAAGVEGSPSPNLKCDEVVSGEGVSAECSSRPTVHVGSDTQEHLVQSVGGRPSESVHTHSEACVSSGDTSVVHGRSRSASTDSKSGWAKEYILQEGALRVHEELSSPVGCYSS